MSGLEDRAAAAEAKLAALCDRIGAAEKALAACPPAETTADGNAPLQAYQLDMLSQLRQLRAKMAAEGGGTASGAEVEALKADNERMAAENKALNFRIVHLLRALDDAEKAT